MNALKNFSIWWTLILIMATPAWAVRYNYAIVGDAGEWNENTQKVRDSILFNNVEKLILPGDNLYATIFPAYDDAWKPWSSKGLLFDLVAIGNHNLSYEREIQYFKMPGEFYAKAIPKVARFIVLNSDNQESVKKQISWLKTELNSASEPYIFIIYHHPSLTLSQSHHWEEKKEFQRAMHEVIRKYRSKLTAIIVGHDHIASFFEFDDLPVIVSGATHDLRKHVFTDNQQEGFNVKKVWSYNSKNPFWALLSIERDGDVISNDNENDDPEMHASVGFINAQSSAPEFVAELFTGKRAQPVTLLNLPPTLKKPITKKKPTKS